MHPIRIILTVSKWVALGLFWLLALITRPNLSIEGGCGTFETLLALVTGNDASVKGCTLNAGVATPSLSFADDGSVSWGWTLFETSWHVALWFACVVGSYLIWKKLRARFTSRQKTPRNA